MGAPESYESFRARLDGAAISTYAMAMTAVPVKIWCRSQVGGWRSVGWDDGLALATLVCANVFFWDNMLGLRPWLGRTVGVDVTLDEVETFLKFLLVASLSYVVSIAFIKYTILSFYWKLFSVAAQWPIKILTFTVVAWMIIFLSLGAFGCQPIKAQWDLEAMKTAKCVPPKSIYLGASLPNAITDFILVLMPIPYVWRLKIPLQQRLILVGMFLLGLFICIVSIFRLTIIMAIGVGDPNVTYNLKDFMLWSIVEINIGLVCSCLPSMRHMLKAVGLGRLFSLGSTGPSGQGKPSNGPSEQNTGYSGSDVFNSRKTDSKKRPGWWTVSGLTRIDSEEDAYQMIDHAANPNGQTISAAEAGMRVSEDTDKASGSGGGGGRTGSSPPKNHQGIVIEQSWSVMSRGTNP